ncbi:hypothetical protein D3C87_2007880 [compost metagenome]
MVYESSTLVVFSFVVVECPDNHITIRIAIHIARAGYRATELGIGLVAFEYRCGNTGNACT